MASSSRSGWFQRRRAFGRFDVGRGNGRRAVPIRLLRASGWFAVSRCCGLIGVALSERSTFIERPWLWRAPGGGGAQFDGPHNPRLHLTAPLELFHMQPVVNGCNVWDNPAP